LIFLNRKPSYFDFSRWIVELHLAATQFRSEPGIISRGALNNGLTSVDSGAPVKSGGDPINGVSAKIRLWGSFNRAEDKVKLSDNVIEQAFTRSVTVIQLYFTLSAVAFCRVESQSQRPPVSFSSLGTKKRFPSSPCASAIQVIRRYNPRLQHSP
jgi:hypothetical protein